MAGRIPDILQDSGYSVWLAEPRQEPGRARVEFDYVVSDGVRKAHLTGVAHKDRLIVLLDRVGSGLNLRGLWGREEFASAVINCLLREGASAPPPPDEMSLRNLAERGHEGAKMALDELLREKRRKGAAEGSGC